MENTELRSTLAVHLDTLKRNLAVVSLDVLKTKYQKPYSVLKKDIENAASAYVRQVAFNELRIRKDLLEEARPFIESAIEKSGLLKQIASSVLHNQSIDEIDRLALNLKETIQKSLEPFYEKYLCLYLKEKCFAESPEIPEIYNEATGCILQGGTWIPLEDSAPAVLMYLRGQQDNAA